MSDKVELRLDWCSYEAAKYAVEHWHYSKTMPVSKSVKIGAWEDGKYIGAVIYCWGANPNLSAAFGLEMIECSELVRVALTTHKTETSKIISIASKMIKKQSPGVKLLVSFADQREGHHGGIYQAAGWTYTGETSKKFDFELGGQILQRRSYTGKNFGGTRRRVPPGAEKVESPPKYRYVFILDKSDKQLARLVESMKRPYPKRERGETDNAAETNPQTGGASPTRSLLDKKDNGTPD